MNEGQAESSQASDPSAPAAVPGVNSASMPKKGNKKTKLLVVGFFAALLVAAGVAAAMQFGAKTPEKALQSALGNTSNAVESLLDTYLTTNNEQEVQVALNNVAVDGSIVVEQPIAGEASIKGGLSDQGGQFDASIAAVGLSVDAELRLVADAQEGAAPDVYAKLSGLDGVGALLGAFGGAEVDGIGEQLSALNDQWYVIDGTLFDQTLQGAGIDQSQTLTEEDIQSLRTAVFAVLNDRVFTDNTERSIFSVIEESSNEEFDGKDMHRLRVRLQKTQMVAFVDELQQALDETEAAKKLFMLDTDTSFKDALNTDELKQAIEELDTDSAIADVWVEPSGRYVRNVRIYENASDSASMYIDFGLDYEGGDAFPLTITMSNGAQGMVDLGMTVYANKPDLSLRFMVDMGQDEEAFKASGTLEIAEGDQTFQVEAPTDAKSIFELLGGAQGLLGLDALNGLDGGEADDPFDDLQIDPEVEQLLDDLNSQNEVTI